jgi:hypothetical protein
MCGKRSLPGGFSGLARRRTLRNMLIILLVIIFWAVIPGLITGWMLWERGWSFPPAFLLGAVGGPLGILLTLALISAGSFKSRHRRAPASRGAHGRAFRVYYDVPVVGRLHVSTVWALAGVATFTCVWMLAGLAYEFYAARQGRGVKEAASQLALRTDASKPGAGSAQATQPGAAKPSEGGAQPNASSSPSAPLLNSFGAQPRQTAQVAAGSANASTQMAQPSPFGPSGATTSGAATPPPLSAEAAPPKSPAESSVAPPAAPKVSAQEREAAVSDVTRSLGAAGHRVHAALSGDARTATLSLSGATLTRAAGNQLLGGRARAALKASGIRIVVMVNGQESWTYIL